jgi:hypothetical protein
MAAWFLPAVKLILPHVGTIVEAARPVFTKRKADGPEPASVVQQQIAELQAAASQNAALVAELAQKLELTVRALEEAGTVMQAKVKRLYTVSIVSVLLAAGALVVALGALVTR